MTGRWRSGLVINDCPDSDSSLFPITVAQRQQLMSQAPTALPPLPSRIGKRGIAHKPALKISRRSDGVFSGGDHFHGFRVPPGGMTTSGAKLFANLGELGRPLANLLRCG
jgi:hypothetical protein